VVIAEPAGQHVAAPSADPAVASGVAGKRAGEGGANQALDRIEDVVARLARGAAQGGQVHAAFSQEAKSNPAAASATLAGRSLASSASRRPR
jgi:hypothetical protein